MLSLTTPFGFCSAINVIRQSGLKLLTYVCTALFLAAGLWGCGGTDSDSRNDQADDAHAGIIISPNDSRLYRAIVLTNGLEVLLVSDPSTDKSAASLSVGVGLLSDPTDYAGMAHYLEHMLFLGTEKYPEPDAYSSFVRQNGGANNAYTWLDITNYMLEIKNAAYDESLDRFSQFFTAPLLSPDYIEKEKNAVNAEWTMRRELDTFVDFRLTRSLLGDHPANRFLIGNLESLADKADSTLHETTVDFYQSYYSANIMKLALVSNRSLDDMAALAETYFGSIPNKGIAKPEVTAGIDFAEAGGKLIRLVPMKDRRALRLEFVIENNTADFAAKPNEYVSYILSSEMPGTPATVLRDKGWVSALTSMAKPTDFGNYGAFVIDAELTEEGMAHRQEISELLLGYVELLRDGGVDDRYAQEFKTSLDNRFRFLEKTSAYQYATQLSAAMQVYPIANTVDADYHFEGFDKAAIDALLAQLTPERLRVWYISKEEPGTETIQYHAGRYALEPLEVGTADTRAELVASYGLELPALNRLLPESFEVSHAAPVPAKVLEKPGIEIWLQGSEAFPEQPRGFTRIELNNAAVEQSASAVVYLSLWADLYQQSQVSLFNEAVLSGMYPSVSLGYGLTLSLSGFTDKQPALIEEMLKGLSINPSEQAFEQALDRYRRSLINSKLDMGMRQLFPSLSKLVKTGEYPDAVLAKEADSASITGLKTFIEQQLSASLARVYLFGNYSTESASGLANVIEATLPKLSGSEYRRAGTYAPIDATALVYQEDLPIEDLSMLYLFAAKDTGIVREAEGRVLSTYLGTRAFNQLRTEEQLGYAAGGFATTVGDHPFIGFYIQTPVKAPEAMLARFDAYREEFAGDLTALEPAKFEEIKAGVLTTLREPPKNLAEEASPYLSDWSRERYSFDTEAKLIEAVEAVTLESIQRYYQETVMAAEPSTILVQLRGKRFADDPYAAIEGAEVVSDIETFHARMPMQEQSPNQN